MALLTGNRWSHYDSSGLTESEEFFKTSVSVGIRKWHYIAPLYTFKKILDLQAHNAFFKL